MKKAFKILPFAVLLPALIAIPTAKDVNSVFAKELQYTEAELPTTINLNDVEAADVRNYYASLNSKSEDERKGQNLLKNLKPILMENQKYYSYDKGSGKSNSIWKMYEITDRDWVKSPASDLGALYDAVTNTITGYTYGTTDPYVRALYVDRNIDNPKTAWGNHTQRGNIQCIEREHIWPKSHGFDADDVSGARGDPMHLWAADGYSNGTHNNYFYGYVDTTRTYKNCHDEDHPWNGNNLWGFAKTISGTSSSVFEPQDCDKGDIARACFYMVARYNNIGGDDTQINSANPNLSLSNDVSLSEEVGTSTGTRSYSLGILSDLLEWNELDPVDDYEIHRNNILFRNFTNNRNPFIDFPSWANIIWGDVAKAANPTNDPLNGGNPNTISNFKVENIEYGKGTVSATANALDGTVIYAYSRNENGPFTADVPTEAGVWYCQATSEAIGDYTADTQVTSFRIIGTPNQIKDFEIGDVKTGGTVAPTAKADVGDVTFLYSTSEKGPFTETAPTEEGTYYVKAVSINKDGIESQSAIKQFRIYTPTFIDNICEATGLTPTVVYIIIAAIVVVILIIILVIYCKGKKKTKNKIKKGAKNVAKDFGIDIPKAPSSSSTKKSSSSTKKSTSSSKSSSSKSSASKSTTKKK